MRSSKFIAYRGLILKMVSLPDSGWNDGDRNFEVKKLLRHLDGQLEGMRQAIEYLSYIWRNKGLNKKNWKPNLANTS